MLSSSTSTASTLSRILLSHTETTDWELLPAFRTLAFKSEDFLIKITRDAQKRFRYVKLMSTGSVNLYKSFTYLQPDEYRFSHDSVFLARKAYEIVRDENIKSAHIMDLCAGCGIVGLDFAFHAAKELSFQIHSLDFLEVQDIYAPYLVKNLERFGQEANLDLKSNFYFENYANVTSQPEFSEGYDLILCNPPYFDRNQGKLSPSDFKNRCRFFIDSGFSELLRSINFLLKPHASAFILVQSLHDHKIDPLLELKEYPQLTLKSRGKIRATDLYQLTKIP
jgi:tRNA1Val (adenine37-N6)-methyltransferase